jgi:hypothetical protein
MTQALCLRCGGIKFGAYCPCLHCHAPEDPDRLLSVALSDHHLPVSVLERIGRLVSAVSRATPDGDLRRAVLLEFFRARFPASYHRPVAPSLLEPARALLASLPLPDVRIVTRTPEEQWLAELQRVAAFGTRDRLWRAIVAELQRNPALIASAKPGRPGSPDLTILDLSTMSASTCDPELAVDPRRSTGAADLVRAQHVVKLVALRRDRLERLGSFAGAHQRAFLLGETPAAIPLPLPPDYRGVAYRRAILRCAGRDHDLAALVGDREAYQRRLR